MPRLPNIQYTQGVQSLGRQDVYGPIQTAQAQSRALMALPGVFDSWAKVASESLINEKVAQYRLQVKELTEQVLSAKMIDVYDPAFAGMDLEYDPDTAITEGDRLMVPADQVALQIYDSRMKEISEGTIGKLKTKKQKDKFYGSTSDLTATSRSKVVSDVMDKRISHYKGVYKTAYDVAVAQGNAQEAERLTNQYYALGVIGPEERADNLKGLAGRAQESIINQRMASNDINKLQELKSDLLLNRYQISPGVFTPWSIPPSKLAARAEQVESRIRFLQTEALRKRKEVKDQASKELYDQHIIKLDETKRPYSSAELSILIPQMTRADRNNFLAVNRAYDKEKRTTGGIQDDMVVKNDFQKRIAMLSMASDIPSWRRMEIIQQEIRTAMDLDQITGKTGQQLLKDSSNALMEVFQTPSFQSAEDYLYSHLTGGTKDTLSLSEPGAASLAYANAVLEMRQAAIEKGLGFNAEAWAQQNLERFATETVKENLNTLFEEGFATYIVEDIIIDASGKKTMKVDKDKTKHNLKEAYRNNEITREQFERATRMTRIMWGEVLSGEDIPKFPH